jgi:hypothetical protein
MGKPLPKGATPTPGIPDTSTQKGRTNPPLSSSNSNVNPPAISDTKTNTQVRTVRKP